jgi:hypothetical protein
MIKMKRLIRSLVIASGGLFLAATASNAAGISFTQKGSHLDLDEIRDIQTSIGQLIDFKISIDTTGIITAPDFASDSIEVIFSILVDQKELLLTHPSTPSSGYTDKAHLFRNTSVEFTTVQVKVLEGLFSDGKSDFTLKVNSAFTVNPKNIPGQDVTKLFGAEQIVEVQPVPEPTTIFGSALALGVGGWLKRKKLT